MGILRRTKRTAGISTTELFKRVIDRGPGLLTKSGSSAVLSSMLEKKLDAKLEKIVAMQGSGPGPNGTPKPKLG